MEGTFCTHTHVIPLMHGMSSFWVIQFLQKHEWCCDFSLSFKWAFATRAFRTKGVSLFHTYTAPADFELKLWEVLYLHLSVEALLQSCCYRVSQQQNVYSIIFIFSGIIFHLVVSFFKPSACSFLVNGAKKWKKSQPLANGAKEWQKLISSSHTSSTALSNKPPFSLRPESAGARGHDGNIHSAAANDSSMI